jgi:hypothetical protein
MDEQAARRPGRLDQGRPAVGVPLVYRDVRGEMP